MGTVNDLPFVRFIQINVRRYVEIAERYGIMGMPALLLFRNGEVVYQAIGSMGREGLDGHLAQMLYQ